MLVGPIVPARAYTFPQFGDTIHDYGVDLDFDGLYDELRIDFTTTVVENATYGFEAMLGTATHPYILHDAFDKTLAAGTYTLTFTFLGPYLRKAGVDGPYTLLVRGSVYVGTIRYSGSEKSYTTAAYAATSFEPPWAQFADPITDEGRDTNGDGLFDDIVVHASISALREVVVMGYADMSVQGPDGWAQVQSPIGDARRLSPGVWAIEFPLETLPLFTVHANGPYTATLSLYVVGLGSIDWRSHQTQAYTYTSFRRPSADFRSPNPSVGLVDRDGNGLADLFVVRVPLHVTEAGDFTVSTNLWLDAYGIYQSASGAHLDVGDTTVEVPFSGIDLGRHPYSANWTLEVNVRRVDASEYDRNRTTWLTPGYDPALFESRPLAYLYGRMVWPGPGPPPGGGCGSASLMDPTTKFAVTQYVNYGMFSIPAYSGNFLLLVRSCGVPTGARTVNVTISGDTTVSIPLANRRNSLDLDTNLSSWNYLVQTIRSTLSDSAPELRFLADELGNRDGFADSEELRVAAASESGLFNYGGPTANLGVDGLPLAFQSIESFHLGGADDVLSSANLTETLVEDFASQAEPIGTRHNVTLAVAYDGPFGDVRAEAHLPSGSTGTAIASANVTVVQLSASDWAIDPGGAPTPQLYYGYVYIDAVAPGSGVGLPGTLFGLTLGWILGPVAAIAVASIGMALWIRRRKRLRFPGEAPLEPPKPPGP